MVSNNQLVLMRRWLGKSLPDAYIGLTDEEKKLGFFVKLKIYFTRYFIHPVKRRIAKYYLLILTNLFGLKVIGITGSAGKTTTKEMLVSILKLNGEVKYSTANIDPVYNIPTTILKCSPFTKFLILEMGVEYQGEMDFYLWLARPDIGIITNVYLTHTEFFGNLEGVMKEKIKLALFLPNRGIAILNANQPEIRDLAKKLKCKVLWVGKATDFYPDNVCLDENMGTNYTLVLNKSKLNIQLPIYGKQIVEDSLFAAAAASEMGLSEDAICSGLKNYNYPEHRLNIKKLKSGALLIDDSYNNNPSAALGALQTLEDVSKNRKKIIVFGEMLELGDLEIKAHRQVGKIIGSMKSVKLLIGVGESSKVLIEEARPRLGLAKTFWVRDVKEAYLKLKDRIGSNDTILVKGSRKIGLDKLVQMLS